jgi:two-component system, LytTR family, sensor kinase
VSGPSRRVSTVALVALASTVAGLYFTTQAMYAYPEEVRSPWAKSLAVNLVFYWMWGAAVPVVVRLGRRFPLDQSSWRRSVPIHVVAGALVTLAQIVVGELVLEALHRAAGIGPFGGIESAVVTLFHSSYPTYWVILLAAAVWRAASLQARLAEARLAALRAQLQPHFLFNTLNSISSLMYRDVEAADVMIARLSDLLRLTLHGDQRREIPLGEEIALLQRYLDIERVRFEERMRIAVDIAGDAEAALVPPFLLQPIVENAVRHAIAPRPAGGSIEIAARVEGDRLVIRVRDDGPGLAPGEAVLGVGLANTRARLAELHGSAALLDLDLDQPADGGTTVTIAMPWRT